MRSTRVLHVATSDMAIQFLLLNRLRGLKDAGFDVSASCSPGPYVSRVEAAGIEVHPVRMWRAVTPLADAKAAATLYRLFQEIRPTIVHTHTPKAGLLGQYAALAARVPLRVHTIHGLYFPGQMSQRTRPLYVWLERLTMRFTHLAIAVNPEDISVAIAERICSPERLRYLGNGIDLRRFDPATISNGVVTELRRGWGIGAQDQVVGIVGRVNREKGYEDFFAAASILVRQVPAVKFLVVGPVEPEKPDALDPLALARRHGLTRHVIWTGVRFDMPALYRLMDLLVLPSHREGFPLAPMEAAAMARPTVATDIRGCRQVVRHGETGLLVPVRDPEALAEAVLKLLNETDLIRRMGQAARALAIREFDEDVVIERTVEVYRELLHRYQLEPAHSEAG